MPETERNSLGSDVVGGLYRAPTATWYDEMSVVVDDLWLSAWQCHLAGEVDYEMTMSTAVDGPVETASSRTPAPKKISVISDRYILCKYGPYFNSDKHRPISIVPTTFALSCHELK